MNFKKRLDFKSFLTMCSCRIDTFKAKSIFNRKKILNVTQLGYINKKAIKCFLKYTDSEKANII